MKKCTKTIAAIGASMLIALTGVGGALSVGAADEQDLSPDVQWNTNYKITGKFPGFYSVIQTSDDGYITSGTTDGSTTTADAVIVKYNASGTKVSEITYHGDDGSSFNDIKQTSDGGLIAVGTYKVTTPEGSRENVIPLIVKYDSSGTKQWEKTIPGIDYSFFCSVILTSDGGYIAVGSTFQNDTNQNDALIVKYDKSGNTVWQTARGGTDFENFSSVQQTSDGGYITAGTCTKATDWSRTGTLVKFTASGQESWHVSYLDNDSSFYDVKQSSDGSYIAVGDKLISDGSDETLVPLIAKYDSNGAKLWDKTFLGSFYGDFDAVILTADGGYIVAGETSQTEDNIYTDALVVKYLDNGTAVWSKTISNDKKMLNCFTDVEQTSDGGLVLSGYSQTDGKFTDGFAFIVKYSSIYDKDNDGIPNNRDSYPLDPAKGSDTTKTNLNSSPQKQIAGTQSGSSCSGTVKYEDYSTLPSNSNVEFKLNNVSVTFPVELLDSNLRGIVTDSLKMSQGTSSQNTVNHASLLISSGEKIVGSFDFSLQKVSADGSTSEIHQLGGNVKITVRLTDEQIAQLKNGGTPKIYYFNTQTNALEPIDAVFDFQAKTVTFYTNHFSTYVIKAGTPAAAKTASAKTGDSTSVLLYSAAASASFAVLVFICINKKRQYKVSLTD